MQYSHAEAIIYGGTSFCSDSLSDGDTIFGKAFIIRFVLDISESLGNFPKSENIATVDAHGYVIENPHI